MAIPKKKKVNVAGVMAQILGPQQIDEPSVVIIPPERADAPVVPAEAPEVTPEMVADPPVYSRLTYAPDKVPQAPAKKPELAAPMAKPSTQKKSSGRPTLPHEGELVKRGFYLPAEVVEALRIRQFQEPNLTLSNHVVLALKQYLGMD